MRYRSVLALPHVRSLVLVTSLARIPSTATSVALTLHAVLTLHRGFGAAGALVAALTVGGAVGAPLTGRLTDRRGLRPTLALTACAQGAFWLLAPLLPYPVLLAVAFFGGLLMLPLFSVSRQSLAALVPEEQRRTAFSLDSMSVEVSFAIGPAAGVLVATQVSTRAALVGIGVAMLAAGIVLYLLNPPVRSEAEQRTAATLTRLSPRTWLDHRLILVLLASIGATIVLAGTDVSIVATLRRSGELPWSGLVLAAWCCWSLLGGFVHGLLPRSLPALALATLLCVLTMPVGIAGHWWTLMVALLPAGFMCAPTLASTSELVSRAVPAAVRGEALGMQTSALTTGVAAGAPLAGAVVDRYGPALAFVAVGAAGLVLLLVALATGALIRASTRSADLLS